jgi:hypothetical protein
MAIIISQSTLQQRLETTGAVSKLTITCSELRPLQRNTLCGFALVEIAEVKLTIRDVAIHQKNNSRWAQLPAKPQITKDGTVVKDPATGKVAYTHLMDFSSREVRDAFCAAVVRAVLARAPDAFAGVAA